MTIEVGDIIEGKVNGLTKFGCFIDLEGGESGLVHISEISNRYVQNIEDFVKVGDVVKAKVVEINENGKIALSMKAIEEPPKPLIEEGDEQSPFEILMSKYIKESNEKIQSINQRTSRRRGSNKPKK
ncbi:MAG: S1 RNA-binding domain-containing protein [Ezakiella sp.]|nr:S1 RNA-binding domain-containing protein [Ezakiella sp.]MDD7762085.1 S1 RNA-binding domain-containing protein [Bacillota bacterium]MDY3947698.1 S1 RNA-binding domain-containing protein [Ezakiella sp.]